MGDMEQMIILQSKEHSTSPDVHQLHIQMDKQQQERTTLSRDLLKAKSQIVQLEEDKVKYKSSISNLESRQKEKLKEALKLKEMLTGTEQKLRIKEMEVQSLNEKMLFYVEEVKCLQKKVLKLEVAMKTEQRKVNELELRNGTGEKEKECSKCKLMEMAKMKEMSEMATVDKDRIIELRRAKQETEHFQSQSLQKEKTVVQLNSSAAQRTSLHQRHK